MLSRKLFIHNFCARKTEYHVYLQPLSNVYIYMKKEETRRAKGPTAEAASRGNRIQNLTEEHRRLPGTEEKSTGEGDMTTKIYYIREIKIQILKKLLERKRLPVF